MEEDRAAMEAVERDVIEVQTADKLFLQTVQQMGLESLLLARLKDSGITTESQTSGEPGDRERPSCVMRVRMSPEEKVEQTSEAQGKGGSLSETASN